MAVTYRPSVTLDGAPVVLGDGTDKVRSLSFDSGEFTLPAWLRVGANVSKIEGLPYQIAVKGSTIEVLSSDPTGTTPPSGPMYDIATLPRVTPNAAEPTTFGYTTLTVGKTGGTYNYAEITQAISAAQSLPSGSGVIIEVNAEPTAYAPITLGAHNQTGFIWIRPRTRVKSYGQRLVQSDKTLLPKIQANGTIAQRCIYVNNTAARWRLEGLYCYGTAVPASGNYQITGMIYHETAGDGSAYPQSVFYDRMYVEGLGRNSNQAPNQWTNPGMYVDGADIAVTGCHIEGINRISNDSQAILIVKGPGAFLFENNFMESDGENFMSGGGSAYNNPAELLPRDITFRRNHLRKRLTWKDDLIAGLTTASVKNLFELKNAEYVLVEDNIFENNWRQAQVGQAFIFKSVNQNPPTAWSFHARCRDVVFRRNWTINTPGVFDLVAIAAQGSQDNSYYETRRFVIHDNIFLFLGFDNYTTGGATTNPPGNPVRRICRLYSNAFPLSEPNGRGGQTIATQEVHMENNTFVGNVTAVLEWLGQASVTHKAISWKFKNNIFAPGQYAFYGGGAYVQRMVDCFNGIATSWEVEGNAFVGHTFNANWHPPNNFWGGTGGTAVNNYTGMFVNDTATDLASRNYTIASGHVLKGAGTDGTDVGCDWSLVGPVYATYRSTAVPA